MAGAIVSASVTPKKTRAVILTEITRAFAYAFNDASLMGTAFRVITAPQGLLEDRWSRPMQLRATMTAGCSGRQDYRGQTSPDDFGVPGPFGLESQTKCLLGGPRENL